MPLTRSATLYAGWCARKHLGGCRPTICLSAAPRGGLVAEQALAGCWLLRRDGVGPAPIIHVTQARQRQSRAMVMGRRTLQSSCESGPFADYDGYKRKRGSKVHMAVDTLG